MNSGFFSKPLDGVNLSYLKRDIEGRQSQPGCPVPLPFCFLPTLSTKTPQTLVGWPQDMCGLPLRVSFTSKFFFREPAMN